MKGKMDLYDFFCAGMAICMLVCVSRPLFSLGGAGLFCSWTLEAGFVGEKREEGREGGGCQIVRKMKTTTNRTEMATKKDRK